MIIIGLTGKIGSGKTTTSKIIKELGYEVFDCDECSRNLINSKKVISQIQTEFKESKDIFINHSEINRNLFGNYLFSNPNELLKLEKILHPLIKKKGKRIYFRKFFKKS